MTPPDPSWCAPPETLMLGDNEVHVWRLRCWQWEGWLVGNGETFAKRLFIDFHGLFDCHRVSDLLTKS